MRNGMERWIIEKATFWAHLKGMEMKYGFPEGLSKNQNNIVYCCSLVCDMIATRGRPAVEHRGGFESRKGVGNENGKNSHRSFFKPATELFQVGGHSSKQVKLFAIFGRLFQAGVMTKPLALVWYEKLLPGSQLVNRLQDLGYRVHVAPDIDALVGCAERERPMLVLADLVASQAKARVAEIITLLRQNPATCHLPVIAFADEKATALRTAATKAGATLVVNEAAILTHLQQFLDQALQVD
jgi:CheY-like chemotaxis protein